LVTSLTGACGPNHLGAHVDGSSEDAGSDANTRRDATVADVPPPPPVGAGSMLLVRGDARLIGQGGDSCTSPKAATSDRWCAFARPSTFITTTDLWVINVTEVLNGKAVTCDGNDSNCLRLSTDLFAGDLTMHGFRGDTLIYYGDNNGDSTNFIGTVFAWRPEWVVPRAITAQNGLQCQAHPTMPAAICFHSPVTDAKTNIFTVGLSAGMLGAVDTGPLPKIDTLLYSAPGDPTNVNKVQVNLSPGGDAALWSARTTANGVETLNFQKLGDPTSRRVVAEDVAKWQVSADSTSWYWLKSFNYSVSGTDSGTLQTAPYPAGAAPATLIEKVGQYSLLGGKTVLIRSGFNAGVGELKLVADVTNIAATTKTLDTGVLRVWDTSADGTTVLYSKTNSGQLFDMFLGSLSKAAPCPLASTAVALGFGHLADNTLTAAWVKVVSATATGAFYTTFDQCTSRQFATNIVTFDPVGDQGYVYEDEGSDTTPEGTLRFNQLVDGQLGARGTVVQQRAFSTAALLWPAHAAVVYSINADGTTDGLYINAKLPFVGTMPPPGSNLDAAVEAATDTGAGGGSDGADNAGPIIDAGSQAGDQSGDQADAAD
jgi:hypothetical protein